MKAKNPIITSIAVVIAVTASSMAFNIPPDITERSTGSSIVKDEYSTTQRQYLTLVNDYRASKSKAPVSLNSQLNHSAQAKADDMDDNNYFEHSDLQGRKSWHLFKDAGYMYTSAGENLAKGYDTPSETVAAWIASPTHEAILVGDYKDMGIGISNDNGRLIVVSHFGIN